MRPWHIRTQQEILDRIHDAIDRGDQGDEFNEYMRCAKFVPLVLRHVYEDTTDADWEEYKRPGEVTSDDVRDIDHTAKTMLPFFESAIRRTEKRGPRTTAYIKHYRAWKWLLGHEDADSFFKRGWTPVRIYNLLLFQVISGQWDKMTGKTKGTNANNTASSVNAQTAA